MFGRRGRCCGGGGGRFFEKRLEKEVGGHNTTVPCRKRPDGLVEFEETLFIVVVEESVAARHDREKIFGSDALSENRHVGTEMSGVIRMTKVIGRRNLRRSEGDLDIVRDKCHLSEILCAIIALVLEGMEPAGVLVVGPEMFE